MLGRLGKLSGQKLLRMSRKWGFAGDKPHRIRPLEVQSVKHLVQGRCQGQAKMGTGPAEAPTADVPSGRGHGSHTGTCGPPAVSHTQTRCTCAMPGTYTPATPTDMQAPPCGHTRGPQRNVGHLQLLVCTAPAQRHGDPTSQTRVNTQENTAHTLLSPRATWGRTHGQGTRKPHDLPTGTPRPRPHMPTPTPKCPGPRGDARI